MENIKPEDEVKIDKKWRELDRLLQKIRWITNNIENNIYNLPNVVLNAMVAKRERLRITVCMLLEDIVRENKGKL